MDRLLLSISLLVLAFSSAPGLHAEAPGALHLDIVGTEFQLTESGLPRRLEGVVFHAAGGQRGAIAGTYSEDVQPDIDPRLGFVGSTGTSTFTFYERGSRSALTSRIVVKNRSRIIGEIPARASLLVESTGTIREATGRYEGLRGTLTTRAEVRLGARPFLEVALTLQLRPGEESASVVPAVAREGSGGPVPAVGRSGTPGWSPASFSPPGSPGVSTSHSSSSPAPDSLLVRLRPDGQVELLYSPLFRARLVQRLLADGSAGVEAVAAETGIAPTVLARWSSEASLLRKLSGARPLLGFLNALQPKSPAEKLRILFEASQLEGEDLEALLRRERVTTEQLAGWRAAVEASLGVSGTPEKGEPVPASGKTEAEPGSPGDSPAPTTEVEPESGLDSVSEALEKLEGESRPVVEPESDGEKDG